MGIIEIIGRHGGTQINLFGIPSAPAVADQYGPYCMVKIGQMGP